MNEQAYPFAIDGHLRLIVDAQVLDFMNLADALHVGSITAGTEDDCDACAWIDVRRRDEGSGGVVDERRELCGHILETPRVQTRSMAVSGERGEETHMSLQAIAEHRSDISAFGIGSAETLGPANEFAVIDALLPITRNAWWLGTRIEFDNDTTHEHGYEN